MKKARYICFEGTEGVGKTTQTKLLVDFLQNKGYKVLQTKEPGTPLSPLTMQLRGIMLDAKYENEITPEARELVSQAIRSIHLKRVILPNLYNHDFIIQDRGIISGFAYGSTCGIKKNDLINLSDFIVDGVVDEHTESPIELYDDIIYLKGDALQGLAKAKLIKQEFAAGDAMEARGSGFMNDVQNSMDLYVKDFNTHTVNVNGLSIEDVFGIILMKLDIRE